MTRAELIARRDYLKSLIAKADRHNEKVYDGAQQYNVLSRGVSRADPEAVQRNILRYQEEIREIENKLNGKGSIRVSRGLPR